MGIYAYLLKKLKINYKFEYGKLLKDIVEIKFKIFKIYKNQQLPFDIIIKQVSV